jgi:hypothetical protein
MHVHDRSQECIRHSNHRLQGQTMQQHIQIVTDQQLNHYTNMSAEVHSASTLTNTTTITNITNNVPDGCRTSS